MALASSPDLRNFLAALAETDRPAVMAALEPIGEAGERIAQFDKLPSWAKEGGSHSQLAKDHADSPFFGAAFVMANNADLTLMTLLKDAWREMGGPDKAPGLEGSLPNEKEEEGEHLDPLVDTGAMDRDRGRKFHETRDIAERVRKTGHADELPGALLTGLIDKLVPLVTAAEADAARYPVARTLARKIRELIATLQGGPSARLLEATVPRPARVDRARARRRRLGRPAHDRRRRGPARRRGRPRDRQLAGRAGRQGRRRPDEHEDHDPAQRSEAHYNRQVTGLAAQRGELGMELDRGARTATSADDAVAAARTTPDKLYAEVDRIINHPFESTWWRAPMKTWLEAAQARGLAVDPRPQPRPDPLALIRRAPRPAS